MAGHDVKLRENRRSEGAQRQETKVSCKAPEWNDLHSGASRAFGVTPSQSKMKTFTIPAILSVLALTLCLTSQNTIAEFGDELAGAGGQVGATKPGAEEPSSGDRPGWEKAANGIRLVNRDVILDAGLPLPETGKGFWYFTNRAITRPQIAALASAGVRYLGVLGEHCYAMQLTGTDQGLARAGLRAIQTTLGTALDLPMDRVSEAVLPYLNLAVSMGAGAADSLVLPHGLGIHFWPRTTAGEVRALVPDADEWFRLPAADSEAIGADYAAELPGTGGVLLKFALNPLVGSVDFVWPKVEDNSASRALATAGPVTGAPRNLDGTGVVVGEWDGGAILATHGDFGGRVSVKETGSLSSHATHVAGTILGSGAGNAPARGFAPGATLVGYNFNGNVPNERRESKHLYRHEHDNHSWGSGGSGGYGGYATTARDFDTDCRDILLLAIKSAGNDGQSSEITVTAPEGNFGYDSIDGTSGCKNVLVIGSAQDNGDLSNFSARGPTNDGRIKPDVTANGQGLLSTYTNTSGYSSISGTSMSAPSTTGVVTLMSQLYKQLNQGQRWAPDVARCVVIHTVRDVFHTGPDYRFGWGLVDADRAATVLEEDAKPDVRRIARGSLREGEEREFTVVVDPGSTELRLTMTWLDAFNGGTAAKRVVHELDLIVTDPSGNRAFPWTLDPANPHDDAVQDKANTIDNIEQVLVNNPVAGEWTVRVKAESVSDPDQPVQGFVLVSSHHITNTTIQVMGVESEGPFMAIPDNSAAGVTLDFPVALSGVTGAVRVFLEINHQRRGDLAVYLKSPDGTERQIEAADTSTRRDLIGIFPDLRSYDDDTIDLLGKSPAGTWSLRVTDTVSGSTGEIRHAMLEIDNDPIPNRAPVANAGPDQTVSAGALVTLNAAASHDPDPGQAITFQWVQVSGPTVSLGTSGNAVATFFAPETTVQLVMEFMVTVTDPYLFTATDTARVQVNPASPKITAVSPNPVAPGMVVTITGSGLTGATVRVSGLLMTVLTQSPTEITARIPPTAPVVLGQALSVTSLFGADATLIDVSYTAAGGGGSTNITGESGGGGCAVSGRGGLAGLMAGLAVIVLAAGMGRRRRRAG